MASFVGSKSVRRESLSDTGVFLIVGAIDHGSPAEDSGLMPGDLIYNFGDIGKHNFFSVKDSIAPYCANHVNEDIPVTIARKNVDMVEEKIDIVVTPKFWSGYGVLGCHFYSLKEKEGAFVKVKDVLPGSPAALSGLINKDHIVEFGTITAETYVDLQKSIAPVIHANIGIPIPVLLKRVIDGVEEYLHLNMTPNYWDGPGVIGCALKTIKPHSKLFLMARRFSGRLSGRMSSSGDNIKRIPPVLSPGSRSSGTFDSPAPTSPRGEAPNPSSPKSGGPSDSSYSMAGSKGSNRSASDIYGKGDWGTIKSDDEEGGDDERF